MSLNFAGLVLGLHLASVHSLPGFNDTNPGLYALAPNGATVGVVRNSYRRTSVYAGHTWRTEGDRFALTVGGITGYPAGRLLPLVVPSVRVPITHELSARLHYLPKPPTHIGAAHALHLSVETRF